MSTKDKYYWLKPTEDKKQDKLDTDIIMRKSQTYGKYISRALSLFFKEDKAFINIKAAEKLIDKALWVSEVLKRKVQGLHQIIEISEEKILDVYLPKQEGLLEVRNQRLLTVVNVKLTKKPTEQQKKTVGYMPFVKDPSAEYLTQESWEKGEIQRAERRNQGKDEKNNERGNERTRGRK